MRPWCLAVSLSLLLVLTARPGLAEEASGVALLDQAIEAYDNLRVEDSLQLLDQAEQAGELGEREAQLHLYRGLGRASLGQSEQADESFQRALELDQEAQLPQDTSPVVIERFEELRRQASAPVVDPPVVDPPVVDPPVVDPPEPQPQPQPQPRGPVPRVMTWVLLGLSGATLVAGGTTLALALVTRSQARGDVHSQEEADDMLDTYRLESRLTFGFLAATAALATITLVTWLGERRRRGAEETEDEAPPVALLPSPGGLVLAGTFGR